MTPSPDSIFHICLKSEWDSALSDGVYRGSSQDAADGFIHFSAGNQVRASAAKHRAGQSGLVLLWVDPSALGAALKWEPSRGGMLFPHLYGPLPLSAVRDVSELPLNRDGSHIFPPKFTAGFPEADGQEEP
ncbi:MAG: DUF952 domain-containing protein [Rhodospirillales bacterium]|nr:DUF952 domain-containing protein [Rhodospirillales bacterium]